MHEYSSDHSKTMLNLKNNLKVIECNLSKLTSDGKILSSKRSLVIQSTIRRCHLLRHELHRVITTLLSECFVKKKLRCTGRGKMQLSRNLYKSSLIAKYRTNRTQSKYSCVKNTEFIVRNTDVITSGSRCVEPLQCYVGKSEDNTTEKTDQQPSQFISAFTKEFNLTKGNNHQSNGRTGKDTESLVKKNKADNLNQHSFLEHSKEYSCAMCEQKFVWQCKLRDHIRDAHTGETPYKCRHCNNSFSSSSKRSQHESTHRNKQHTCETCGKSFVYMSQLRKHRKTHTDEKRYKCDQCPLQFKRADSLREHQRSKHLEDKPYMCGFCATAFASRATLVYHERTHTGEKPYVCNVCGMSFTQSGARNQHQTRCSTKSTQSSISASNQPKSKSNSKKLIKRGAKARGTPVRAVSIEDSELVDVVSSITPSLTSTLDVSCLDQTTSHLRRPVLAPSFPQLGTVVITETAVRANEMALPTLFFNDAAPYLDNELSTRFNVDQLISDRIDREIPELSGFNLPIPALSSDPHPDVRSDTTFQTHDLTRMELARGNEQSKVLGLQHDIDPDQLSDHRELMVGPLVIDEAIEDSRSVLSSTFINEKLTNL